MTTTSIIKSTPIIGITVCFSYQFSAQAQSPEKHTKSKANIMALVAQESPPVICKVPIARSGSNYYILNIHTEQSLTLKLQPDCKNQFFTYTNLI